MNEIGIGLLSFAVICLVVISYLDYRWCKRLEERITELEYKNKHRVFTGGFPPINYHDSKTYITFTSAQRRVHWCRRCTRPDCVLRSRL